MDRSAYRKRVLLGLLTRPISLFPAVVGASALLAAWATGDWSGWLPFLGVAGMLIGVGNFLSSAFTGGGTVAERVVRSIRTEAEQDRERALDDLERRLTEDGDPRTEQSLRDLRRLARTFGDSRGWVSALNAGTGFDILSDVNRMFEASVRYLEKTLGLWHTAQSLEHPTARRALLAQRENLVEEVQRSLEHLGAVLGQLEVLRSGMDRDSDLRGLRAELDQNLDVARRVEERMAEWELPGRQSDSSGGRDAG
jgi:hypothetical protein